MVDIRYLKLQGTSFFVCFFGLGYQECEITGDEI